MLLSEVCQLRPPAGPELIAARLTLVRIGGRPQTGPQRIGPQRKPDGPVLRVGWDRWTLTGTGTSKGLDAAADRPADNDQASGWATEVEEIGRRRNLAAAMGGPDKVARQRATGRLTVRERIAALGGSLSIGQAARGVRVAAIIPLMAPREP